MSFGILCMYSWCLPFQLLRNREKVLMNLPYVMDRKSLQRIILALIEEKRMKSYEITFTMGERKKEVRFYIAVVYMYS